MLRRLETPLAGYDPSPDAGSPWPVQACGRAAGSMEKWGPAAGAVWFQVEKVRRHTQEGWMGAAVTHAHTRARAHTHANASTAACWFARGRPAPSLLHHSNLRLHCCSAHGQTEPTNAHTAEEHTQGTEGTDTNTGPNQSSLPGRVFFHGSGL